MSLPDWHEKIGEMTRQELQAFMLEVLERELQRHRTYLSPDYELLRQLQPLSLGGLKTDQAFIRREEFYE
jgi:hypothetical protein